jgi:membrane fusion protein (multidrug efflux system)
MTSRVAALLLLAFAAACERGAQAPAPPPLEVDVARVEAAKVPVYLEHVGTTEAVNSVEVRARVKGVLEQVQFKEGADVHEGELLFVIEQAPYRAALEQAQGDLARAEATLERSQMDYARAEDLAREQVASQADLDHARAARNEAAASVQGLRAALDKAKLDLGYTEVRAPISGRIGRILVTRGNLVGGTEETVITTIVQLDPIYVYFSPSERERFEVLRLRGEGVYVPRDEIEVHAVLADGSEFPHLGRLDFVDNTVDPKVGTVRVRAVFPNPDKTLLPGEYAKLRILVGRDVPVLLVPARAILEEQGGSTVFVVADDGTVEARPVVAGAISGASRVIESGLQAGERVAVDNLGKLRSGAKVQVRAGAAAS